MRSSLRLIAALAICAAALAGSVYPARIVVDRPRLGVPAIIKAGNELKVEIRESIPFGRPELHLALELGEYRVPLTIGRVSRKGQRRVLSVYIPVRVDAGAYDLVVTLGGRENRLKKAVHVVENFPDKFSVVQMTDLHIGRDLESDAAVERAVEEINIINPSLVMVSGDLVHSGARDEYRRVDQLLSRLEAPVVCAPGNHDHKWWAGYLSSFGFPYHRVDFGQWSIFSLHSGHGRDQMTRSQFKWLAGELERALDGRILVQMHHPMFRYRSLQGMVAELTEALDKAGVPLVLSGNLHADAGFSSDGRFLEGEMEETGTRYLVTAPAGGDQRTGPTGVEPHRGYRLIRIDKGEIASASYDYDGDGTRDPVSSIPLGNLEVVQTGPGSVMVVNNLFESFFDARIRILRSEELKTCCRGAEGRGWDHDKEFCFLETDITARTSFPLKACTKNDPSHPVWSPDDKEREGP